MGSRQARIVNVGHLQDDITIYTISPETGTIIMELIVALVQEQIGISLSTKEDATKLFSDNLDSIGAKYATSNTNSLIVRPRRSIRDKLEKIIAEVKDKVGSLVPLEVALHWEVVAQFVQQFVTDGRFLLNSIYLAIRASDYVNTRKPMISVGTTIHTYLEALWERPRITNNLGLGRSSMFGTKVSMELS